ncbi:sulfite exporter TauE/SafE family protein [Marinitoga lauensis]|uniref:sulfite exporter TauE/SafE family protein n=1 Tax=Marinitoga lauensis TaxID=2201189 RepID=UPI001F0D1DC7|nr:sulfite exporter TauE/SafE family protein [Marinitoga lauensis]
MVSGFMMMLIYHKKALIDWYTGIIMILSVASGSFLGGFISAKISVTILKVTFSLLLLLSAFLISRKKKNLNIKFGPLLKRKCCDHEYNIPLLIVIPAVFLIGFIAGMVGISGGGLIVPLLIILGNMPMRLAFATNSIMVLFSATTGFIGRGLSVGIDWKFNIIMATFAAMGSLIGSHFSTKVKTENLKKIFVYVILIAAIWIIINIFI